MTTNQQNVINHLDFVLEGLYPTVESKRFIKYVSNKFVNGGILIKKININSTENYIFLGDDNINNVLWEIINKSNILKSIFKVNPIDKLDKIPKDFISGNINLLIKNLSSIIHQGGAYLKKTDEKPLQEVQVITHGFIQELLPSEFENYLFTQTFEPWTNWFYNINWDYTAFIYSKDFKEVYIICITDTD